VRYTTRMQATQSAAPVRLGIIGCGNVFGAYAALAEKLQHRGEARVSALCGREHQRETASALCPGTEFFTDYHALLSRAAIDAVVLLTPMQEHARMAAEALHARKHVLVEKPLATSLQEASDLVTLSRAVGRLLVCAPFTVLSPTFQAIAGRLRSGEIGRIVSARGRYGWAGPDWTDWYYKPGGGPLFDLGVYCLTTLTGWLGPVRRVAAMSGVAVPERAVAGHSIQVVADDNTQVLLDFGGQCFAVVTTGFTLQQYRGPGVELFGTDGTIYLHGDDWDPDGYEIWQNTAGCWQLFKETHPDWPWTDGLRHFVECIRMGSTPLTTPEHALHVLEVMLEAQIAAREGRTRNVQSSFTPPVSESGSRAPAAHRVHDRTRAE
jgi:predicted dehydrogenase